MGDDEALKSFKRRVKERYPDSTVYLFGSRARDDHMESSDYDILVIADSFTNQNPVRRREDLYAYWDGDHHADIIAYTEAEFAERSKKITVAREAQQDMVEL